jgi:hypothetical protein
VKFLKQRVRRRAKVSFVLVDWSVRESFHLLHYLTWQDIPRDEFEIIVVEYYSARSAAVDRFESDVDVWLLLQIPEHCYYHKHLMYNVGIAVARGEIVVCCDSDAMVRDGFVRCLLGEFRGDSRIALHFDEFRNVRRDLYPFCFPSFEEVVGRGCINHVSGQTIGLADPADPLHERNYGACLAARRADLLAIGGADEHIDYLGHICGPYDMTFRLANSGLREVWHPREFLYHTWHPGQAGGGNYLGPHDGRHMSTTALEALSTRRVRPYVQNAGIRLLQDAPQADFLTLEPLLLANVDTASWAMDAVLNGRRTAHPRPIDDYRGFRLRTESARCVARLISVEQLPEGLLADVPTIEGTQPSAVKEQINRGLGRAARLISTGGVVYGLVSHSRTAAVQFTKRTLRTAVDAMRSRLGRAQHALSRRVRFAIHALLREWRARGVLGVALDIMVRTLRGCWRLFFRVPVAAARRMRRLAMAIRIMFVSAWRRLVDLLRRFLLEERRRTGSLASLVINLHFLGRDRDARRRVRPMAVMVDTPASAQYLHFLSAIRLVPQARIIHIRSARQLRDELRGVADIERAASVHPVIVIDRECYQKHYAAFGDFGATVGLLVV